MATNTKEKQRKEPPQRSVKNGNAAGNGNPTGAPVSDMIWPVVPLPVAQIDPNPFQPRSAFDPEEMAELILSVKAHGVLQPVTVRTTKAEENSDESDTDKAKNGHTKSIVR